MPSVEIVHSDERLGEIAMDMLLEKNTYPILMLTMRARWVKSKLENNKVISKKHIEFESLLERIAYEFHHEIYSGYNARVILLKNPVRRNAKNKESIKLLLRAGVEIRYIDSPKTIYRLLITRRKLFLSYSDSENDELVVNKGFYYVCDENQEGTDTLIDFYTKEFYKLFGEAKSIKINRKGKISFADSKFKRVMSSISEITIKDNLVLLLGAILGAIFSYLLTLFLK